MTQAQLAEAVERHEQFISQLERETRAPGIETIDALADAFGVSPWELLRAGSDKVSAPPKRDVLAQRVRAVVDVWPGSAHDSLLRILGELGRLANGRSAGGAAKRKKRR
jgi:transcriptional regulator with XRE-family HTH domain